MNKYSLFQVPQSILYGRDSFFNIGKQTKEFGQRALLISDRTMEENGSVASCKELLKKANVEAFAYLGVNSEPTDTHVAEALATLVNNQCNVIVALGGGSCIDCAKAVALIATNGGYIGDYSDGRKGIHKEPLPLLAIPTTAGTGSEVTAVTVITNTKTDIKMMLKHPAFIPKVAIVDPVLTYTLPPDVTAATGIDALSHAIEAYLSRLAHPLTDHFALAAIELIAKNLREAYFNAENIEARERMALASMKAGIAFSNASVALVHGMSRPVGAIFHVPHGISNAMLLPAVLNFTKENAVQPLAEIGRRMRPDLKLLADEHLAEVTIQEVNQLCADLHIPNLKNWGIAQEKFNQYVTKMSMDAIASGSPMNNPRVPSHEEIIKIYHNCYNYNYAAHLNNSSCLS